MDTIPSGTLEGACMAEQPSANSSMSPAIGAPNALLDFFFPGFGVLADAVVRYTGIDLNVYIPLLLLMGGVTLAWRYFTEYAWNLVDKHLMSTVDIRPDDEIYNMVMSWVANQYFAKGARRFVANTNLNSRSWHLWRREEENEEDEYEDSGEASPHRKQKPLAYTPTFGSHWFWYKGRILMFNRTQSASQAGYLTVSEREAISISCFNRNPQVLKDLLLEAREEYMKHDENKTLIYRGASRSGSISEPFWQRCMTRTARPFETVILSEKVKNELIADIADYLNPATRRWYNNRGIPYRRGYLLYGPPGTGKSSLSLALAGHFKMRIYIVSLSSVTANEENMATLFAELPRRCIVLLEDIDTAGLTHTREEGSSDEKDETLGKESNDGSLSRLGKHVLDSMKNGNSSRLSLSGLLNIIDGVASQEGRILIMTTNHLEKLDKALIRPGRIDMIVKFGKADADMTGAIFRAIYAPLEADEEPTAAASRSSSRSRALRDLDNRLLKKAVNALTPNEERKKAANDDEAQRKKEETIAKVKKLAEEFTTKIPAHEFSPAEIQGFLLKHKRDPEKAVELAEQWVIDTRKERKEKELKEAEEKRKAEEEARKKKEGREKKPKEEDEKKEKRRAKQKTKRSKKAKNTDESDASSSDSSSSFSSNEANSASEAEPKNVKSKKTITKTKQAKDTAPAAVEQSSAEVAKFESRTGQQQPVVVVPAPSMTSSVSAPPSIDTEKEKGASLDAQKTPQGADSGYGTP
ncbi:uncharacterized protein CTHT_0043750 [Thermochaetoides thermophila DSM 1495]|uniref:Mitochondrial chaperone BCS1 n=1 Tax=Chaetomium thermophilum (strain DSM 1495 / CBS 144.50 / IMI 039719) TaxID=759272 RepID=G0S8X2_CHATD|nr:hypothetical protein CTHT_0043750 [Thermochaetoides thermophila DSM 1495]EGS19883.1 hypothetical protein CTHT_0043750 [Thermochaetoides thermophila DSM 1495]